ncbi:hypothetical protein SAMN05421800_11844 [Chryseobacterium balustinum]|uniref:Transcriptional regulator n=1 Tax=Chryseobacterium balustinum TaxID=246 RepID=A0AAX2IJ53_9FLAO|nr:hypothetical protein SAMN05421800_11844 [Chryseobacterium balustinum]SQA88853.1 Uncharacterised protein [Chryseobacterium balustinum]
MEKLKLKIEKQNRKHSFQVTEQRIRILETISKFSSDFESLKSNFKEIISVLRSN